MGFKKAELKGIAGPLLRQTYEEAKLPEGCLILQQRDITDDWGGSFKEILRVGDLSDLIPSFSIKQINRSKLSPQTKRFWHIHPKQNEVWVMADGVLNVGLVDMREESKTYKLQSKITLNESKALYIPAGVAHGLINPSFTKQAILIYVTDQYYTSGEDTQEYRIEPGQMPFDFVESDVI